MRILAVRSRVDTSPNILFIWGFILCLVLVVFGCVCKQIFWGEFVLCLVVVAFCTVGTAFQRNCAWMVTSPILSVFKCANHLRYGRVPRRHGQRATRERGIRSYRGRPTSGPPRYDPLRFRTYMLSVGGRPFRDSLSHLLGSYVYIVI